MVSVRGKFFTKKEIREVKRKRVCSYTLAVANDNRSKVINAIPLLEFGIGILDPNSPDSGGIYFA